MIQKKESEKEKKGSVCRVGSMITGKTEDSLYTIERLGYSLILLFSPKLWWNDDVNIYVSPNFMFDTPDYIDIFNATKVSKHP